VENGTSPFIRTFFNDDDDDDDDDALFRPAPAPRPICPSMFALSTLGSAKTDDEIVDLPDDDAAVTRLPPPPFSVTADDEIVGAGGVDIDIDTDEA
jgi:hypothetical protein